MAVSWWNFVASGQWSVVCGHISVRATLRRLKEAILAGMLQHYLLKQDGYETSGLWVKVLRHESDHGAFDTMLILDPPTLHPLRLDTS